MIQGQRGKFHPRSTSCSHHVSVSMLMDCFARHTFNMQLGNVLSEDNMWKDLSMLKHNVSKKNKVRDYGGSWRKMEDRLFGEAWQINWRIRGVGGCVMMDICLVKWKVSAKWENRQVSGRKTVSQRRWDPRCVLVSVFNQSDASCLWSCYVYMS